MGESQGLQRLDVVDKKLAEETAFQQWVDADPARKAKYGKVLADMGAAFEKVRKYRKSAVYLGECALGPEVIQLALQFDGLAKALKPADGKPVNQEDVAKATGQIKAGIAEHFKDNDMAVDKKIFAAMMKMYANDVPADQQPEILTKTLKEKYKGDVDKWTEEVFAKSMFVNQAKTEAFLAKPDLKTLEKDPAYQAATSFYGNFMTNISPLLMPINQEIARCNRLYVEGTMAMLSGKKNFYPNANSTMRMTYGNVAAYKPKDATFYDYKTTLDGIMEKEDPSNDEFIVPAKLKEIYQKKDFGRWAENGTVPVGFISNNDITGGNSGSPVINGNGELVGLAFDGNWEAMSGNIAFEPALQRTISMDIRYVLLMIDKYANAQNLINELKLVQTAKTELAPPPAPVAPVEAVAPAAPAPAPAMQVKPTKGPAPSIMPKGNLKGAAPAKEKK
jgi:hypothetical protein